MYFYFVSVFFVNLWVLVSWWRKRIMPLLVPTLGKGTKSLRFTKCLFRAFYQIKVFIEAAGMFRLARRLFILIFISLFWSVLFKTCNTTLFS